MVELPSAPMQSPRCWSDMSIRMFGRFFAVGDEQARAAAPTEAVSRSRRVRFRGEGCLFTVAATR